MPSKGGLGEAAWVDYDNDGDLDATAVGGRDGFIELASVIFRNDGADSFTLVDPGLPEPMFAGQGWADYDLDGDMDWAVCGVIPGDEITRIYNNDDGVFTDIAVGLEAGNACDLAWGDYDNDGDPDLFLQGPGGAATHAILYRNDVPTGGGFAEVQIDVPENHRGRAAWGDCDNDGDLDLLVTGRDTTAVYLNQGGDTFTELPANLPQVSFSTVAWGDVDGDDDLDILLTGDTGSELITRIYSNTMDVVTPKGTVIFPEKGDRLHFIDPTGTLLSPGVGSGSSSEGTVSLSDLGGSPRPYPFHHTNPRSPISTSIFDVRIPLRFRSAPALLSSGPDLTGP